MNMGSGSKSWIVGSLGVISLLLFGCGGEPLTDQESLRQPIIAGVAASSATKEIQAAILAPSGSGYQIWCGGVYAGQNASGQHWLLTAAHCVASSSFDPNTFRVGLGGLDISQYNTSNTVGITSAEAHSGFNSTTIANDIGAIRLKSDPGVSPVKLATSSTDPSVGESVTISGYGANEALYSWRWYPEELLQADTNVLSTSQCQQTWSNVTSSQICVQDSSGGQGACNGDSGGPMFRQDGTVVGLTSFGQSYCSTGYPQAYTRVSSFRSWITSTTGLLSP